jgi:hypothetical protein
MAVASAIFDPVTHTHQESVMRSILLLLLGIPLPIIILIALFVR